MRILNVVQSYYPFQEKGGTAIKVRALARGFAQRGHHVTVLTADLGLAARTDPSLVVQPCNWGSRTFESGVEAVYLPVLTHYRALTLNRHVLRFCNDELRNFDIVHFYGLYDLLGPTVSRFCRRYEIPYVVEPMGMYRPIDRGFRLKTLWHRTMGRAFCGGAAQIVATSPLEQGELVEEGISREKIVVRYNGVDLSFYEQPPSKGVFRSKWKIPADEKVILFLSRLIPRKGADILIEAFGKVCGKSGWLVIAGPEGERGYLAYLKRQADESGAGSRVLFTGPLYDDEKRAAMADADLFVLPSRYENFANAPAEAIACGVPVLVSDSCGIAPLIAGRAGLTAPAEKSALIESLKTLLEDDKLRARLKEGCRSVAAELRWDRLVEQMEGHYHEVFALAHQSSDEVALAGSRT